MGESSQNFFSGLCRICIDLASADSRQEAMDLLVSGCARVMKAKGCSIRILDEKRELLELGAAYGLSEQYLRKGPVEVAKAPLDRDAIRGEIVDIGDCSKEQCMLYPEEAAREGIESMLCVPLRVKDRIIGVLRVYRSEPRKATPQEINTAVTLAAQGGNILEKFRILEEREGLGQVAQTISSSLDLDNVLQSIVRCAAETLNFKGASVRLLDEEGKRLEIRATYGLSEAYVEKGPVEVQKSPLDLEILSGKAVRVSEEEMDTKLQYPAETKREGIRSMFGLPLQIKGKPVGVLRVYASVPYRFTADDEEFLTALANQGAIAIENARLFQQLKKTYEDLTRDVWKWYDWGKRPPRL
jgi:signal transduction protein with GAF and PtsI domain